MYVDIVISNAFNLNKHFFFFFFLSIPALRVPRGGLAVASAEKAHSCMDSQFDIKQCREQFVTPLSCLQSRSNWLAFQTLVLLRLLRDLDTYGVDPWCVSLISKEGCGYYCSQIKSNFTYVNPSGIVSGVLAVR